MIRQCRWISVLVIVAVTFLHVSTARGQLVFEHQEVDLQAALEDKDAVANFKFTNQGDHPISIREITTSCGCTTAKLDKTEYQSGESGQISATFDFGHRVGQQIKTINIQTADPNQAMIELAMKVYIPEVLILSQRSHHWYIGEAHEPQTIMLKTDHDIPVQIVNVEQVGWGKLKENDQMLEEAFVVSLKTIQEGASFQLTVQPREQVAKGTAYIRISTDWPSAEDGRQFSIFVTVGMKHKRR